MKDFAKKIVIFLLAVAAIIGSLFGLNVKTTLTDEEATAEVTQEEVVTTVEATTEAPVEETVAEVKEETTTAAPEIVEEVAETETHE